MSPSRDRTDVVVIGSGLAGLVAAAQLTAARHRVVLLEQEPRASLGGQAWWSFGGLFLVDSPEQRRLGIRDDADLALADWLGSAQFDAADPTFLGGCLFSGRIAGRSVAAEIA